MASMMIHRSRSGVSQEAPRSHSLRVLWGYFVEQSHPDFFGTVYIDKEAGFKEVDELLQPWRYLGAFITILFLLYNTLAILANNTTILLRWWGDAGDAPKIFTLTGFFLHQRFPNIPAVGWLAATELLLVLCYYLWGGFHLLKVFCARKLCHKWHAVSYVTLTVVPMLSAVSMMKLLNYISPQVFRCDFLNRLRDILEHRDRRCTRDRCFCYLEFLLFFFTRVLCLFLGFDAFLYKFQIVGILFDEFNQGKKSTENDFQQLMLTTFIFVNQVLGAVQLGWFTMDRILKFAFAGPDGYLTRGERALQEAWLAMLCWQMFEKHKMKAIAIYLTFSAADVQKLMLDEYKRPQETAQASGEPSGELAGRGQEAS